MGELAELLMVAGVSPKKCPSPTHLARVPGYAPAQAPPFGYVEPTVSNDSSARYAGHSLAVSCDGRWATE